MNILISETEEGAVRGMRYAVQSMNMSMSLMMSMMMDMGMPKECPG